MKLPRNFRLTYPHDLNYQVGTLNKSCQKTTTLAGR